MIDNNIGNPFHLASKRLLSEVENYKRLETRQVYRGTLRELESIIYFYGLFFVTILRDSGGYYFIVPFNLGLVINYAKKIRTWLDKHKTEKSRLKLMYGQKYLRRQKYLQFGK